MSKQKFIKVDEQDFKSLFDDYEIWLEKLKEIQNKLDFLRISFLGMLQERENLFPTCRGCKFLTSYLKCEKDVFSRYVYPVDRSKCKYRKLREY